MCYTKSVKNILAFHLFCVQHVFLKLVPLKTLQLKQKQHFPLKNFIVNMPSGLLWSLNWPVSTYWPSILSFQCWQFLSILRFVKELGQWCHELLNQHFSNWKASNCILMASWKKSTCLHIRSYQLLKLYYVSVSGSRTQLRRMSYYLFPLIYCQHKWRCLWRQ